MHRMWVITQYSSDQILVLLVEVGTQGENSFREEANEASEPIRT
jgi:hypothetical protein